jgi:hypothetical protein
VVEVESAVTLLVGVNGHSHVAQVVVRVRGRIKKVQEGTSMQRSSPSQMLLAVLLLFGVCEMISFLVIESVV